VVSFGTRDLERVKIYVKNQSERHARGQIEDHLERITILEEAAEAERREAPSNGTCEPRTPIDLP
jgi:hypothetical protein